jgi:hypothetical protein
MGTRTRNFANNILSGGTIDGTDFLSGTLPSSNITNDSAASVTSIPSISNVVSSVAGDPPSPTLGDIWYNSSTNALKFQGFQAAAWSTGGNLSQGRWWGSQNGAGEQTSGIVFGGIEEGLSGYRTDTESYDGSSWTTVNPLNTARQAAGAGGSFTSALIAGGQPNTSASESWDGTSWTNAPSLGTARGYMNGACESETAGVVFGGLPPPVGLGNTELYNGVSWSETNDLNTARRSIGGTGTSTSGLCTGGYTTTSIANAESWDGTSWTNENNQVSVGGGATFGTLTSAVLSQGQPTQLWDGTSWASGVSKSSIVSNGGAVGTSTAGLVAGGEPPNNGVTTVEEYVGTSAISKTFTTD